MEFTPQHLIKQPQVKAVFHEQNEQDHILGGDIAGDVFDEIKSNGQYLDELPIIEIQHNNRGNTYGCVSFSRNNAIEIIHKVRYGEEINLCDRYIVVGSGTKMGSGNSKRAVAEWGRKNYWVDESRWLYGQEMTPTEYYNNGIVPKELLAEGALLEPVYDIKFKWLSDNLAETIKIGIRISPVQVDVEPYKFDSHGYIINSYQGYVHEVLIVGYEDKVCWYVLDSENEQLVKFAWNYNFGAPMIHSIKKKDMTQVKYNHPLIKDMSGIGREISFLAKSGTSANNYIHIFDSETFKALYGDFDPKKYVKVLATPSNIARAEGGAKLCILTVPETFIFSGEGIVSVDTEGLTNYLKSLSAITAEE